LTHRVTTFKMSYKKAVYGLEMENKAFKIAGIKNLMRTNYNVSPDMIDLEAEVDNNITMAENWSNMKERVIMLSPKQLIR